MISSSTPIRLRSQYHPLRYLGEQVLLIASRPEELELPHDALEAARLAMRPLGLVHTIHLLQSHTISYVYINIYLTYIYIYIYIVYIRYIYI